MKTIIKLRWLLLIIWIGGLVLLLGTAPDMQNLVREKGVITVPEGYSSATANRILNDSKPEQADQMAIVLVFHHEQGLSDSDRGEIQAAVQRMRQNSERLGITSLLSPLDSPLLAAQMTAKDGRTMIVSLGVEPRNRDAAQIRTDLNEELKDVQIEHYLTGSGLIDEDVVLSSQKGLKRTESITVVFILAILLLVFRSAVAPLIPLLSVGISYVASQSIVAFLVDQWGFPLSTFTQIFMVAVMFGIGTDYCILLLSRFKEEIASGKNKAEAVIHTYRTAGKTVFFSGLAALVGFAIIGLAHFKLYQSAMAVAVGVGVLLIALMTLVPFFMMLFGKGIFWPTRNRGLQHKNSKLWGAAGHFSWKRPLVALAIVAAIAIPLLASYNGTLSFDSLDDLGDSYDSVKGFNRIANGFGPGEAMPTQIVLKSDHPMDTGEDLAAIEKISAAVAQLPGVEKVRSATRPMGEPMQAAGMQAGSQIGLQTDPQAGSQADPQADLQVDSQADSQANLQADSQADPQANLQADPQAGPMVIPDEMIRQPDFQLVLNNYMPGDRTVTTLQVILNQYPYSDQALDTAEQINRIVAPSLRGTSLEGADYGVGGITGTYSDLRSISNSDYKRTVTLMLIGIALILIILLRSLVMPLYLIASLLLCYFTSMAVTELIFTRIFDYSGISWTIPFFGFVLLMALGVDYSIFLMDRFNEYRHMTVQEALLLAMRKMGTVIFSAAIILAGTFAAMLPSGVLSLLQVATAVLTGLLLYALVFLPLFVPVMVRLFGRANWWPFKPGRSETQAETAESRPSGGGSS